jgi:hypothetical protein
VGKVKDHMQVSGIAEGPQIILTMASNGKEKPKGE